MPLERVLTAGLESHPFGPNAVLWDCESGLHICNTREHASDIQQCEPHSVGGVNADGEGMSITESCTFLDQRFGRTALHECAVANILSQGMAKDQGFRVTFDDTHDLFRVRHRAGGPTYVFGRQVGVNGKRSRHYAMDLNTYLPLHDVPFAMVGYDGPPTVAANEARYTKRQVADAQAALRFLDVMGGPPLPAAIGMANSMLHPPVTEADLRRAVAIYGPMLRTVKGSTAKRRSAEASKEVPQLFDPEPQVLELDIAYVKGHMFLIGLLCPLDLCIAQALTGGKGAHELVEGIKAITAQARSRGFPVTEIRCDNEAGIRDADTITFLQTQGLPVEFVGAGAHCPRVERRIRWIKEKYRGIEHSLPYALNNFLIGWGVLAAARYTNLQRTASSTTDTCPRDKFLRRRFNYNIDARISFGEYIHCTAADTDNTSKSRTDGCIALMSRDNHTGTIYAYHLATRKLVVRDNFTRLPIPQTLTDLLTKSAASQGHSRGTMPLPAQEFGVDAELAAPSEGATGGESVERWQMARGDPSAGAEGQVNRGDSERNRGDTARNGGDNAAHARIQGANDDTVPTETNGVEPSYWNENMLSLTTARLPALRARPKLHTLAVREGVNFADGEFELALLRQFERTKDWRDHEYALTISVKAAIRDYGDSGTQTIEKEMGQMLSKQVFHPVRASGLSPSQLRRIIPCKLFIKEKTDPHGVFDKLKGRLVAGGHRQDKTLYEDLSSPTADQSSVMTIAAIAACEHRKVATCDIGGAYLNAPMDPTGIIVNMRIDRTLSAILAKLDPVYADFLDEKGTCIVQLDKALYGCIESAALWYAQLSTFLTTELGFVANTHDPCVFNMNNKAGKQLTIVLHVDDMLLTCEDESTIQDVLAAIEARYPDTTVGCGPKINFLGMSMDFEVKGECAVTMNGMVDDVVDKAEVDGTATTPAASTLFEVDESKTPVACGGYQGQEWFHSFVAKILYLAKRVKPECLTTVAFLATRVNKADEDDIGKLKRLVRYLRASRGRGLRLRPGARGVNVRAYIDAAYGVHIDGKSHSGAAMMVGDNALVHVKSGKQSIVTKSSTESELVATSDNMNTAFHVRNFIIAQGHDTQPVDLLQDNLSCIALMERGRSNSMRTRHIQIRYFWIKERLEDGEARVTHMSTDLMGPANVLTKPLQGSQFIVERQALTNWDDECEVENVE